MYDYKIIGKIYYSVFQWKAERWKEIPNMRKAETQGKHIDPFYQFQFHFPFISVFVYMWVLIVRCVSLESYVYYLTSSINTLWLMRMLQQRDPGRIEIIFGGELSLKITPISSEVRIIDNKVNGHAQVSRPP